MSQSLVQIFVHLIFATKGRHMWIQPEMEDDLYAYLGGIVRNRKSVLIKGNGTENHIHLVIRLHADVALSSLVRDLKSNSSTWMKKMEPRFSWQGGYGAFSCSKSQLDTLLHYVERQKEHHRAHTFEEEMKGLAEKWGCRWEWDEETDEQSWTENSV